MCISIFKKKETNNQVEETVEQCIARWAEGMSDPQKAEYWYHVCQQAFAILGKIDIPLFEITSAQWKKAALTQYPTLTDIKIADSDYFTTNLEGIEEILVRDWTNLVPYVSQISDCDKFGTRLYIHLCDYYKINSIIPVWGETDRGYHGFNLAVVYNENDNLIARIIEPQSDNIFIEDGPLGKYVPQETAIELGIKGITI